MNSKLIFSLTFSLFASVSIANVGTDMDSFFNKAGYSSNTTLPNVWQNQAAGSFGGGSIYARNAVHTYQLIRLDLPEVRAGCGGIDLYTGSFSFIKADELVSLGKQIMTNSGAYVVDLMLATTVPEILDQVKYLQGLMQTVNNTNINSCNAAKALVGGLWPKTKASQTKICEDLRTSGPDGLGTDYAKAKQDCASLDKFNETMKVAEKDKDYKKQVLMNKNIVWDAISQHPFLSKDKELAEFVMNLTGTVIFDAKGQPSIVPSIADNQQLIKAFIGDGASDVALEIQKCPAENDTKCISVHSGKMEISKDNSLTARIQKIISSLSEKLRTKSVNGGESNYTDEEKRFVSMTSMPILKFITIMGQMKYGLTSSDLNEYSSLIAQDLFQQYIGELLTAVKHSVAHSQIQEDLLKDMQDKVHQAQVTIAKLDPKVSRKIREKLALIGRMREFEKEVAVEFANQIRT